MRFAWDPDKRELNLRDRGFDFAFASLIVDGPTLEQPDSRREYGEARVVAIGLAHGLEVTVCYTDRRDMGSDLECRIISARRSNRRERKAFQEALKAR